MGLKQRKIIWDNTAKHSLREIYQYIKKHESISIAKNVRSAVIDKVKGLETLSHRFSQEEFLDDFPI